MEIVQKRRINKALMQSLTRFGETGLFSLVMVFAIFIGIRALNFLLASEMLKDVVYKMSVPGELILGLCIGFLLALFLFLFFFFVYMENLALAMWNFLYNGFPDENGIVVKVRYLNSITNPYSFDDVGVLSFEKEKINFGGVTSSWEVSNQQIKSIEISTYGRYKFLFKLKSTVLMIKNYDGTNTQIQLSYAGNPSYFKVRNRNVFIFERLKSFAAIG